MFVYDIPHCLRRSKYFDPKISSLKAFRATASFFVKMYLVKTSFMTKASLLKMLLWIIALADGDEDDLAKEMLEVCRLFVRSNKQCILRNTQVTQRYKLIQVLRPNVQTVHGFVFLKCAAYCHQSVVVLVQRTKQLYIVPGIINMW